jgi:DNA-binding transcriptional LysR family regulator
MELRWLDDFCALARTRHFSRAADERHVSQPTFSRRIKLLEEEMGVILIDRNSLPLRLTRAGEVFLLSCEDISSRLRQTKSQCRAIDQQQQDQLSLATSQALLLSFLPSWRQTLAQQLAAKGNDNDNDGLEVNLASSNWLGSEYGQALLQGQCDLLMSYWHPAMQLDAELNPAEVEFIVLGQDQLLPMSANDPYGQVQFDLSNEANTKPIPYIAYHPKTLLAQVIQAQVQPLFPSQLVTVNENSQAASSKALIQQGFGLGWLPRRLAQAELQQGTLRIAGDHQWHISLQIRLYRRRNNPSTKLQALWKILQTNSLII